MLHQQWKRHTQKIPGWYKAIPISLGPSKIEVDGRGLIAPDLSASVSSEAPGTPRLKSFAYTIHIFSHLGDLSHYRMLNIILLIFDTSMKEADSDAIKLERQRAHVFTNNYQPTTATKICTKPVEQHQAQHRTDVPYKNRRLLN